MCSGKKFFFSFQICMFLFWSSLLLDVKQNAILVILFLRVGLLRPVLSVQQVLRKQKSCIWRSCKGFPSGCFFVELVVCCTVSDNVEQFWPEWQTTDQHILPINIVSQRSATFKFKFYGLSKWRFTALLFPKFLCLWQCCCTCVSLWEVRWQKRTGLSGFNQHCWLNSWRCDFDDSGKKTARREQILFPPTVWMAVLNQLQKKKEKKRKQRFERQGTIIGSSDLGQEVDIVKERGNFGWNERTSRVLMGRNRHMQLCFLNVDRSLGPINPCRLSIYFFLFFGDNKRKPRCLHRHLFSLSDGVNTPL